MNNQVELSRDFSRAFMKITCQHASRIQSKTLRWRFSCSACCVANNLRERFINDKLHEHKAIICITKFQTGETIKRSITIADYCCVAVFRDNRNFTYLPLHEKVAYCGIVSNKEDIKLYNTKDEVGNSIRVAAFEDQASRFFPLIDNGQVYYLSGSGSSIQETNQQYNSTGHVYELRLLHDSEVSLCTDSQ
uniref:Uncharacterized protein n=1 Tax=Ditylenchus dipsaci TaxID=166011 RepID=A0A915E1K5_9BILA